MRVGAVNTIAAGHDARNAASRPTVPVPDGAARARIPACGSSDIMKAGDAEAARRLIRPCAATGHPVTGQRQERRRRPSLHARSGACHGAGAMAAAFGRGHRQLTPALLGVG